MIQRAFCGGLRNRSCRDYEYGQTEDERPAAQQSRSTDLTHKTSRSFKYYIRLPVQPGSQHDNTAAAHASRDPAERGRVNTAIDRGSREIRVVGHVQPVRADLDSEALIDLELLGEGSIHIEQ